MTFSVPTKVVHGLGSVEQLPQEIHSLRLRRVALVVDAGLANAGLADPVVSLLPDELVGARVDVPADPSLADVEGLLTSVRESECDGVVILGGGSAMAVGKAAGILLANEVALADLEGLTTTEHKPKPVIAIPSTAGSGSEVSRVLVVHQEGRHTDLAIRIDGSQPAVAILDGELMRSLPETPMLYAGLDALTHALESLWAKGQNHFTRALGVHAAKELYDVLPPALEGSRNGKNTSGDQDDVLQRLIEASCAANMACGTSGMGLVHGFASAPSIHLPHGLRNGIMLPYIAAFNRDYMDDVAVQLIDRLPAFLDDLGFKATFAGYDLPATAMDDMIAATVGHPFRENNVRRATDEELAELLKQADLPDGDGGAAA